MKIKLTSHETYKGAQRILVGKYGNLNNHTLTLFILTDSEMYKPEFEYTFKT